MSKKIIFGLIDKLCEEKNLRPEEFLLLLNSVENNFVMDYISQKAQEVTKKYFGNKIYIRGLIEFSNFCKK